MTENEAIKWQKSFKKTYNGFPPETEEACDMAIKALEEIQQYRAIGTIEEIKEKLSLLEKYEELGTVEELDEVLNMLC